ncbi:T9SS type A sorting domain-containing protein [Candidatus Kuenenbacteria bacterium]|nr:T9SS type A sorting domain-containing protein [Candidatus Kuenenbacteria bacterium]
MFWGSSAAREKPQPIYIGRVENLILQILDKGVKATWDLTTPTTPINICIIETSGGDSVIFRTSFLDTGAVVVDDLRPGNYWIGITIGNSCTTAGGWFFIPPARYLLFPNYPNPFNPSTNITYTLAKKCRVSLAVYNMRGELVETLIDTDQHAGNHTITWNATNVPSGVYLCRMQAGDYIATKKMTLMK